MMRITALCGVSDLFPRFCLENMHNFVVEADTALQGKQFSAIYFLGRAFRSSRHLVVAPEQSAQISRESERLTPKMALSFLHRTFKVDSANHDGPLLRQIGRSYLGQCRVGTYYRLDWTARLD